MRTFSYLTKRIIIFGIGLFIMSFGVALSVKANLGISPISCIPYVLSLNFPLSLGNLTILFSILLVLIQIIILRNKFKVLQLIQIPFVIIFGYFIDLSLFLCSGIEVHSYWLRAIIFMISCITMGFGVFLEIHANVTYLPGEGVAMAISDTFHFNFSRAKIMTDSSFVFFGIISSLLLLGTVQGIREGTIIAALLIGYIAKLFGKINFRGTVK